MTVNPPDLARDILAGARSLDEILREGAAGPPASDEAVAWAAETVRRWADTAAGGDSEAFARRLRWDGLDADSVVKTLASGRAAPCVGAEWSDALDLILEVAQSLEVTPPRAGGGAFAPVWRPLAAAVRARLDDSCPPTVIVSGAVDDLEDQLVTSLGRASESLLGRRFVDPAPSAESAPTPSSWARLVGDLRDGAMAEVLHEAPVAARHLSWVVMTWHAAVSELVERLASDADDLAQTFNGGSSLGPAVAFRSGLSDRHHDGRRVVGVRFECGVELAYKPRSLGVEVAFQNLLNDLAGFGLEPAPPRMRILDCGSWGWVEWVTPSGWVDEATARRWARMAGSLLCLAQVLGATDLHMDNLVVGDDGPYLIDLESILQPRPVAVEGEDSHPVPDESVLRSGMIACLKLGPRAGVYDMSALGGVGGHLAAADERVWSDLHSDGMRSIRRDRRALPERNVVVVGGRVRPLAAWPDELVAGFEAAWRALAGHRAELGADRGALAAFRGLEVRTLIRDSGAYAAVLAAMLEADAQADGVLPSILADSLHRGAAARSEPPAMWPLADAERRSLEGLDVPYFTTTTDGAELRVRGADPVAGYFAASGLDEMQGRLETLDEERLETRCRELEFCAAVAAGDDRVGPDGAPLVAAARYILERIRGRLENDETDLEKVGDDPIERLASGFLYEGRWGTALALVALGHVTGDRPWAEAGRRIAAPIAPLLGDRRWAKDAEPVAIGAGNGVGGLVYPAAVAGALSGDSWWLDRSLEAAELIDERAILADDRLDVEGGAAGAILALLAAEAATGESWLLERAVRCGQRLLAAAEPIDGVGLHWVGADGLAHAGFAHGAAGIAAALASLGARVGFEPFIEAAQAGLAWQDSLFDAGRGNWALEVPGSDGGEPRRIFMCAWCHGAAGIALGHRALRRATRERAPDPRFVTAVRTTARAGMARSDHLCCGTMGRVEALTTVAKDLGDVALLRAATARALMILRRGMTTVSFRVDDDRARPGQASNGLFRGEAGIAYGLLRCSGAGGLPSVLSLDPLEAKA